eukprot:scaffold25528_cov123-Isochrysis_galbana.AAC.1
MAACRRCAADAFEGAPVSISHLLVFCASALPVARRPRHRSRARKVGEAERQRCWVARDESGCMQ